VNRRSFAGFSLAAVGGIFVPEFGRWYRQSLPEQYAQWELLGMNQHGETVRVLLPRVSVQMVGSLPRGEVPASVAYANANCVIQVARLHLPGRGHWLDHRLQDMAVTMGSTLSMGTARLALA
jgi:hypothetical protein